MTGWGFLALVLSVFIATLLGFAWGAQWQREEQKVRDAFAADALERRQRQAQARTQQRQPAPRLPLYVAVPDTDAQRRRNAMNEHPADGSR